MKTNALLLVLISSTALATSPKIEEEFYVEDPNKSHLWKLQKNFIIDHLSGEGYEVYGPKGSQEQLELLQVPFERIYQPSGILKDDYPTSAEVAIKLQQLASEFPKISQLIKIGESVNGQDLLVLKISDNVQLDEVEVEVKYISSMHGNEITGRELLLKLARDLLESYDNDSHFTDLINNTEIFIMPSMNPDGSDKRVRHNANGADLNRDFPDFTTADNQNTTGNRQVETIAIMNFQKSRNFALSANLHGGSEVVNYPYDTSRGTHPLGSFVRDISLIYSKQVPYMYRSQEFPEGVVRGVDWYEVNGGMQDWSYHWHNDLQVTIELSGEKWPSYSKISYYYEQNRQAMIDYLSLVHQGAGFVTKSPMLRGQVSVAKKSNQSLIGTYNFSDGQFYKVLPVGHYLFNITSDKGKKEVLEVEISNTHSGKYYSSSL